MSLPGLPPYAMCPIGYGQVLKASDTQHRVTAERPDLGEIYQDRGPDGKPRLVRILKNAASATLHARYPVTSSTSAGRFGKDAAAESTDDAVAVLGIVEEGYGAGVPDGYYFRAVVRGTMDLILGDDNDNRCTLSIGNRVVTGGTTGTVWGQSSSPTAAEIQNCIGKALEATTKVTDALAHFSVAVDINF